MPTGWQVVLGFGAGSTLTLGVLAVASAGPGWASLVRMVGTASGLVIAALAATGGSSAERAVRLALAVGLAAWLVVEVAHGTLAGSSEAIVTALAIMAAAAMTGLYAATAGRVPRPRRAGLLLDAVTVFLTVATVCTVVLGPFAAGSPAASRSFVAATLLLATAGVILLVNVAVLAELRAHGGYLVMAGVATSGLALASRAVMGIGPADADPGWPSLVGGAGALLVGIGAATWSERSDGSDAYARLAARVQRYLPLGAAGTTAVALLAAEVATPSAPGDVERVAETLVAAVLLTVVARQRLLLGEAERSQRRERSVADELRVTPDPPMTSAVSDAETTNQVPF